MKDRILDLLARGIPAANVALAVGCDESYISQLMADEAFASEVQTAKAANFSKYTEADDSADRVEKAALQKLEDMLGFVTKPAEAARIYAILNAAKRRVPAATLQQNTPSTIVNISLPEVARVTMLTDATKQVVEVDGRPLATMPAKQLIETQQARQQQRAQTLLSTPVPMNYRLGQTLADKL